MSVIIKVDTGFCGAIHEEDTGLTVEEWKSLSDGSKNEYLKGSISDNISSYAVDGDNEEEPLE